MNTVPTDNGPIKQTDELNDGYWVSREDYERFQRLGENMVYLNHQNKMMFTRGMLAGYGLGFFMACIMWSLATGNY